MMSTTQPVTERPARSPSPADLRASMQAAAKRLAEMQRAEGDFELTASSTKPPESATDNLFATATVISVAGRFLPDTCVTRAARYIMERREPNGLWAWAPDGAIPADADDTAICLGALACAGVALDGQRDARLLRKFWRWGGPFQTWLAKGGWSERSRDDPVVNCNVLWALRMLGVRIRSRETNAVRRMLARHSGATRYYCSAGSVAWAAARVGVEAPSLAPPDGAALDGRPLECALWTLALPTPPAAAAGLLMDMNDPPRGGALEAWIMDHKGAWHSEAVTTAFGVAALARLLGS